MQIQKSQQFSSTTVLLYLVWPFCTAAILDPNTLNEDILEMRTIPVM